MTTTFREGQLVRRLLTVIHGGEMVMSANLKDCRPYYVPREEDW